MNMIDVFVKVWADTPMRAYMALAVIERLRMFEHARTTILLAEKTWPLDEPDEPVPFADRLHVVERERFWITTKQYADHGPSHVDREHRSPIYVVLDDDHLPIGKTWLEDGVAAMERHPAFAMLSSWSINGEVAPNAASTAFDDVWDESGCSVGTPYFCRRQSLGTLPDGPLESYDQVLTDHVRKIGRVGFLRHVRHNHIGYGYSQIVPGHWGA